MSRDRHATHTKISVTQLTVCTADLCTNLQPPEDCMLVAGDPIAGEPNTQPDSALKVTSNDSLQYAGRSSKLQDSDRIALQGGLRPPRSRVGSYRKLGPVTVTVNGYYGY